MLPSHGGREGGVAPKIVRSVEIISVNQCLSVGQGPVNGFFRGGMFPYSCDVKAIPTLWWDVQAVPSGNGHPDNYTLRGDFFPAVFCALKSQIVSDSSSFRSHPPTALGILRSFVGKCLGRYLSG